MTMLDRLAERGGCARRAQIALGSREVAELRSLVGCGAVTRISRGLYALPGTDAAVVLARRASGLLTCASAASAIGLPLLVRPTAVHLAVSGHTAAPRAGAVARGSVLHWDSGLTVRAEDRDVVVPVPVALAHALRCLPGREAIALVDAALNRRLVTVPELAALRPRAGKITFDRLLRDVDGRSQSIPETCARIALRAEGFSLEPQVRIAGVGTVDLLVEELVVVELDGFSYHSDRAQFGEDRRRDRALQLIGIPVLRFTCHDAVDDVGRLVAEVGSLVGQLKRTGQPVLDRSLRRGARDW
ncbi:MAG: type IV toxin-antitoxin system AbiEi family antitoxin domain-containing protein [Cellulomonas sp.]